MSLEAAALATGSGEGEERRRPKEKSGDDFCAAFALEATVLLGADARRDAEDAEQRDTVRERQPARLEGPAAASMLSSSLQTPPTPTPTARKSEPTTLASSILSLKALARCELFALAGGLESRSRSRAE